MALKTIRNYMADKYMADKDKFNIPNIVFTGNYIDRGPDSKGVIDRLIKLTKTKTAYGLKYNSVVTLKGNHESFMLDAYLGIGIDFWVMYNGGAQTYKSYGLAPFTANYQFPEEHIRFVLGLPLYRDDGKRLYVHAGVDNGKPLEDQEESRLRWKMYNSHPSRLSQREDGLEDSDMYNIYGETHDMDIGVRHVVHGHHQFEDGPMLFTNRSNFDTLAWYTGRLVIGVFDSDTKGGPIDTIEVNGSHYNRRYR